jgi:limonene-1,2-epoxide hydrolase
MSAERRSINRLSEDLGQDFVLETQKQPLVFAVPPRVESGLFDVLRDATPEILNNETVSQVRAILGSGGLPNYDRHWAAFAYMYYMANFAKAFLGASLLVERPRNRPLSIIDLGCGGGASTLGVVSALCSQLNVGVSRIVGIDASTVQLDLFNNVTAPGLHELCPSAQIETHRDDIVHFLRSKSPVADIAVLSYVMEELTSEERSEVRQLLRQLLKPTAAEVIIIDSATNAPGFTIETLHKTVRLLDSGMLRVSLPEFASLGVSTPPKSTLQELKIGGVQSTLLSAYFAAWETQDVSEIRRIFGKHSIYQILGSRVLHGRDEIMAYWERNKRLQRDVHCRIIRSAVSGNTEFAQWRATFYRTDKDAWYSLNGLMWVTVENGTIVHLLESYARDVRKDREK